MHTLTNDELYNIHGGAISLGGGFLIAAGIVFLIGVMMDNNHNDYKCNKEVFIMDWFNLISDEEIMIYMLMI